MDLGNGGAGADCGVAGIAGATDAGEGGDDAGSIDFADDVGGVIDELHVALGVEGQAGGVV